VRLLRASRPSRPHLAAATLAVALLAAACGGGDTELTVDDPWVRSNPNLLGAAYMTITSPVDDELVAASVDPSIAGTVEVHEVAMDDGMMRMREVAGITLPAGEAVALEPGGFHLMLLDMPAMLAPGTEVAITLTFASGATATVTAEVRESAVPEDHMDMHDGHGSHSGHGS
jgi:copper(I)-binding protein